MLNRNQNIPPTITMNPGSRMFITLARDLAFTYGSLNPMPLLRLALCAVVLLLGATGPLLAAAGTENVNTPYVNRPALPLSPASSQSKTGGANGAAPPSPARSASNAPMSPSVAEWRIELADGSLSRAMRRWSRDAKFPVLWEAPKDLPVVAATYRGRFLDALRSVMADTQNTEYPMHACAHDNVVRILHVSQSCTR